MALVLEQINVEGITQLSSLVGDDRAGVAAAINIYLLLVVDIYLLQLTQLYVPFLLPGLAVDNRSRTIENKREAYPSGNRALIK